MASSSQQVLRHFLAPAERSPAEPLAKAYGEGSRGGRVLGHTRSGKPIYAKHRDRVVAAGQYTPQDHHDAHNWHDHMSSLHRSAADNALDAADEENVSAGLHDHLMARHDHLWKLARKHSKIRDWHYQKYQAGLNAQEKADEQAWRELQRRHAQAG